MEQPIELPRFRAR